MTPASENDGKVFDSIRSVLMNAEVYGDKAYHRPDAQEIQKQEGLTVLPPVKKKDKNIWKQINNGYQLLFPELVNRLKHSLAGFSVLERFVHSKD